MLYYFSVASLLTATCTTTFPHTWQMKLVFDVEVKVATSLLLLSNYLLSSQGDRMAMAHSIEGRYPFLDYRVMSFAMALPPRLLLRGLKEKYILKKAAKSIVPDSIVERAKQPYRAPVANVFFDNCKESYVNYFLSNEQLKMSGIFNASILISISAARVEIWRMQPSNWGFIVPICIEKWSNWGWKLPANNFCKSHFGILPLDQLGQVRYNLRFRISVFFYQNPLKCTR